MRAVRRCLVCQNVRCHLFNFMIADGEIGIVTYQACFTEMKEIQAGLGVILLRVGYLCGIPIQLYIITLCLFIQTINIKLKKSDK